MNKQEVFDKVWAHFVVGKSKPGLSPDGRCAYRGANGTRCAFGILIPDHLYDPEMENRSAWSVLRDNDELMAYLGDDVGSLVADMQGAHDDAAKCSLFHDEIESGLRGVADDYSGVKVPE